MTRTTTTIDWFAKVDWQGYEATLRQIPSTPVGGVYLWVFKGNPNRVWYVGETSTPFTHRFADHFKYSLTGQYSTIMNISNRDYLEVLRDHVIGKTRAESDAGKTVYIPNGDVGSIAERVQKFGFDNTVDFGSACLKQCQFFFGKLAPYSGQLRKQAERTIQEALIAKYKEILGVTSLSPKDSRGFPVGGLTNSYNPDLRLSFAGSFVNDLPAELRELFATKVSSSAA